MLYFISFKDFFTVITLLIVWIVPLFPVITIFNVLFPLLNEDISILPSNPQLSPVEYPGYTLFTSVLLVPYLIVPYDTLSIKASTDLIPFEFNAHPFINKLSVVTVAFDDGTSKQLLASKTTFFTVIALFIVWTVPSLPVITTFKVLFPLLNEDISIVPSNPLLSPLGYPGYTLFTSVLGTPYLIVP